MSETRVCPQCGYETMTFGEQEIYTCPECPPGDVNLMREWIYERRLDRNLDPDGPILEPRSGWLLDVQTRGEVSLCPKCEQPITDHSHKTASEVIVEPCSHLVHASEVPEVFEDD